jgi:hypothetical protein
MLWQLPLLWDMPWLDDVFGGIRGWEHRCILIGSKYRTGESWFSIRVHVAQRRLDQVRVGDEVADVHWLVLSNMFIFIQSRRIGYIRITISSCWWAYDGYWRWLCRCSLPLEPGDQLVWLRSCLQLPSPVEAQRPHVWYYRSRLPRDLPLALLHHRHDAPAASDLAYV